MQNKEKTYNNHQKSLLSDYDINSSDSKETILMKKCLRPLIIFLERKGIMQSYNFEAIRRKHKIKTKKFNEFIVILNSINCNSLVDCFPSSRQINKTNYSHKNIIFTYHAVTNPKMMLDEFRKFVFNELDQMMNKLELIYDIKNKIEEVCGGHISNISQYSSSPHINTNSSDKSIDINPVLTLSQSLAESDPERSLLELNYNKDNIDITGAYDNINDEYFNGDDIGNNDTTNVFDIFENASNIFNDNPNNSDDENKLL